MPSPIFLSKPSSGFTVSSMLRGAQLAFVGIFRAIQNPDLARHGYYKKAAVLVLYSLAFEFAFKLLFDILAGFLSIFRAPESTMNNFVWVSDHVLQFRQLLLYILKDVSTMDNLFLMSLDHVDHTNTAKHPDSDRLYGNLKDHEPVKYPFTDNTSARWRVLRKYARKIRFSVLTWVLSSLPVIGRWVLPIAAFQSFKDVAGTSAAFITFMIGFACPRSWLITFLGTYWGTKSMMNDLLTPYFSRLPFSLSARRLWYENRQGIIFGFGAMFYISTKIPYLGLFLYGIASASTAYLVTKISDPIPRHHLSAWTEEQAIWTSCQDEPGAMSRKY